MSVSRTLNSSGRTKAYLLLPSFLRALDRFGEFWHLSPDSNTKAKFRSWLRWPAVSLHMLFLLDHLEKKSMARKKDVCIVTAGVARTPGMSRDDLLGINCRIMREVPEKTS